MALSRTSIVGSTGYTSQLWRSGVSIQGSVVVVLGGHLPFGYLDPFSWSLHHVFQPPGVWVRNRYGLKAPHAFNLSCLSWIWTPREIELMTTQEPLIQLSGLAGAYEEDVCPIALLHESRSLRPLHKTKRTRQLWQYGIWKTPSNSS